MLPDVPYTPTTYKDQITAFGGMNMRDDAQSGELIDAEGLGFTGYPNLSPLPAAEHRYSVSNGGSVFEWNEKLVVIDGSDVLYDGDIVGKVSAGEKQFAVVNTKLIIWPDKVYIDLTNSSFGRLADYAEASETTGAAISTDSIKLGKSGVYQATTDWLPVQNSFFNNAFYKESWKIKKYSKLEWTNGAWVGTGETEITVDVSGGLAAGDIVKLAASSIDGVYQLNAKSIFTDAGVSTEGSYAEDMAEYYAVITNVKKEISEDLPTSKIYVWHCEFNVIHAGDEDDRPLSEIFDVGERVFVSKVPGVDPETLYTIKSIDDSGRKLTFTEGFDEKITKLTRTITLTAAKAKDEKVTLSECVYGIPQAGTYAKTVISAIMPEDAPAGSRIYYAANDSSTGAATDGIFLINSESGKSIACTAEEATTSGSSTGGVTFYGDEHAAGTIMAEVRVERKIPDMDFICAHNNRLYGVSNNEESKAEDGSKFTSRVIHVSALGLPQRFYDFETAATDSYAVAEGSNGDFTACREYGDYVIFFKEHLIIKFYGDYPSTMGYSLEEVEGVREGCYRSLAVINDVLYYMGRHGYYAYGGSSPSLISYRLGDFDAESERAIAAADGREIWLWVKGRNMLYSYNTVLGMWLAAGKKDAVAISDMCRLGNGFAVMAGKTIYSDEEIPTLTEDTGERPPASWSAVFNYFTASSYKNGSQVSFMHKDVRYIRMRAICAAGAEISVSFKAGEQAVKKIYTAQKEGYQTVRIPLPPMRVDSFQISLSGKGLCRIMTMEAEYFVGAEI